MDPQPEPRNQRKLCVHALRQNPDDFRARGRNPADEQYDLQLKPVPVLLKNGVVVRWAGVRHPFGNRF